MNKINKMALFGAQLIYTVLMFLLLSKLGKYYSLGRYLLCNKLFRYVCPGSEDLKKSIRNHYKSSKFQFKFKKPSVQHLKLNIF